MRGEELQAGGASALVARESSAGSLDFEKLATYLGALANAGRLELLHQLREPKAVGEIRLQPTDPAALGAARNISRQAVRKQLAKLEDAGLVTVRLGRRGGTTVEERVVNHPMLFAVGEELRRVTQLSPTVALPPAATMTASAGRPGGKARGARLVMVHGPREGQTFPLDPRAQASGRGWVLGRKRGLAVSLEHDPFVSQEHAEVLLRGPGFELLDLRNNKNGTQLNWEQLPRGGAAPLAHGDVVGIGRTLLLFREH